MLKSIGNMGASILLRSGEGGATTPGGDASKPVSLADVVKQAAAGERLRRVISSDTARGSVFRLAATDGREASVGGDTKGSRC